MGSHTITLIGPPGSGKSTMSALTAVQKPVHFLDIDRKIGAMESVRSAISKGDVTFWELKETIAEESLAARAQAMAKNQKPLRMPQGWHRFAEMVDKLPKDEVAKGAGTWVVDSFTGLVPHLTALILHHDDSGTSTFSQRNWGSFMSMWLETVTALRDNAKMYDKDLIITIHERVSEVPTAATKIMHTKNSQGQVQREFLGQMDMKIAASIPGQFGIQMASHFEEVYGLRVDVDASGKPTWICRVLPDGKRDLRTSFAVSQPEFPPDFRVIWGIKR